jgi:thiol:disulfide interchange protein DsbD
MPLSRAPAGAEGPAPPERPGAFWILLAVFTGGLALNLTPCVYPLIPITVSYFAGRSGRRKGRLLLHALLYLAGLVLTNATLGVIASLTGSLMGELLRNPVVLIAVSSVLLVLAGSLFGLWELRLPVRLTSMAARPRAGYLGSLLMGVSLGIVAAPCIGPFVLGLLTWVARMGSVWLGFVVFSLLSLGLGLPLFVLALFSGMVERLPRSGEWMVWIRKLMAWVLVGMAAYLVRPVLHEVLGVVLLAGVAAAAGIHLGWLERTRSGFRGFTWIRAAAGVAGVVVAAALIGSWAMTAPGITWEAYSHGLREEARRAGKPMVIDFWAAWCPPCRAMDRITFSDARVVARSTEVVMAKVDLTRRGNALHDRMIREFGVRGVPTLVFLDRDGRERIELRAVDFLPADQFLDRLVLVTGESSPPQIGN